METILTQTVKDWELIICDSYSDDGSWEFFQKFKADPRIRMYQVPREGIFAGWNECLQRATGEYIYIATSDDTAEPTLLAKLLEALQAHQEVDIAVCDFAPIDERGQTVNPKSIMSNQMMFFADWLEKRCIRSGKTEFLLQACFGSTWITMASLLFRRKLVHRIGLFRTDCGAGADIEWGMRAALASDIAYIPEKLSTWRIHEQQASRIEMRKQGAMLSHTQMAIDVIRAVLDDARSGIPESWQDVPNWQAQILNVYQTEYLDSLGVFRGIARRDPRRFVKNCWIALKCEPTFLFSQAVRGFPWSEKYSPDRVAIARHLIRTFAAPWPPVIWSQPNTVESSDITRTSSHYFDTVLCQNHTT
jgi:glycosyltransferase involved in cell wall biosynthesis